MSTGYEKATEDTMVTIPAETFNGINDENQSLRDKLIEAKDILRKIVVDALRTGDCKTWSVAEIQAFLAHAPGDSVVVRREDLEKLVNWYIKFTSSHAHTETKVVNHLKAALDALKAEGGEG